jgi:hypothetical protein
MSSPTTPIRSQPPSPPRPEKLKLGEFRDYELRNDGALDFDVAGLDGQAQVAL